MHDERQRNQIKNMKTLSQKINSEANRISREYIAILAAGKEPATLAAQIEAQRYGIMSNINDARANMNDTVEKVRRLALHLIKTDLHAMPHLAQRLTDFRAARAARDYQAAAEESRNWKPLPALA